jgi:type VI secretion system protein VasJ
MALIEDVASYTAPFCEPIQGESPTGQDLSHDQEFEEVKQEIDKLSSVSGAQPNWSMVVVVGEELLRNRTKEFRLLVWIAVAKFHTTGILGLVQGLALLRDVSARFWDDMHPGLKRKRARANLLGWLSEQAEAKLGSYQQGNLKQTDAEPLGAIESIYTELDTFYRDKLAELYPGMGTLRSTAREKLRLIPEEKKAPPPPPAGAAAPAGDAPPGAPPPQAGSALTAPIQVSSPEDAERAVLALGKNLREIARTLRHGDPAQAWSYRLHRVGLWLPVRQLPPVQEGKTRLPAPAADDRKRLERLHSAAQWMDLIEAAETLSSQYLFWLDPHRYLAQAMEQLGALFMQALEMVTSEVGGFCRRVSGVAQAKFNDGTPFADPATEAWLEEHSKTGSGGGGSKAIEAEDAEIAKRFEEARELVKKGRVPDGLGLATQLASRGQDARTRFKARLEIAQMALLGGQPKMAFAITASLVGEAEQHQLEVWEPSLCAQMYSTQVSCLRSLDPKERAAAGDEGALFAKLSRLDPVAALRLSSG